MIVLRLFVGLVLVAHGLVHLLYLAADVPEFSLDRSWLVPEAGRRPVAYALMAATIVAFALVALAVWQVPGLAGVWPALTVIAAALSTVLLLLFWDWHLVLGLVINAALVAGALVRPAWLEQFMGGG